MPREELPIRFHAGRCSSKLLFMVPALVAFARFSTAFGALGWIRVGHAGQLRNREGRLAVARRIRASGLAFEFLQAGVEIRQIPFGKPSSDSPGKEQPLRAMVTNNQRTEIFAAAFGRCVAADHEF
jgi:hypothetical protein